MTSFRELDAWKYAMELTDVVYDIVKRFPSDERYALGDQLRRAVVSIPSNIAEGFGRESHADFAHFLAQAKGSLFEVDTQLEIAVRRNFIASSDVPIDLMNTISKLIGALSRHLRATPSPHKARRGMPGAVCIVLCALCLVPGALCLAWST